jgi:mono/diheme cytochrome c family protein
MKRCLLALLLMSAATTLQAAEAETPEQQQTWNKSLFEARCGICHQLPEPDMLTPAQWKRSMEVMQKRMQQADMAPLDEEEFAQVHAYLSSLAR